ncbi:MULTISPECIES: guanine deaminase [unclassified Mesorhizobium]|uniref:guanine deaminase n=1 Tax=unclassified Mesorhizobium TaxID=325217 RepID=UPI00112B8BDA|nr:MULTISPECIES: guanine deaminase [unclassified Mesorhizobium]TPI54365.1 guanine deaminase [Mesorhizobium sp. B3-1-1]TPJ65124.1 guanine deaminase [Mesorhizobium sp. B2-6-7]TPJ84408.1 guanine deaminase [Mesorhizobium sp. B2-6-3]TPK01837.1 guanine deaminase [Mesorhizobium sp. B2-5-10]TPK08710.1 guanine deaminase [Mesorhizobium sp. B2-5-11]
MTREAFTLLGTAFHTPERGRLEVLKDHLFSIDAQGRIAEILAPGHPEYAARKTDARQAGSLVELGEGQFLLPGLIDLHIHAPQWPQMGKALDVPLEVWLQKYTFPLEARYADTGYAREVYADLIDNLLANGTTTALYFATVHVEASLALAEICLEKGQRALVGKVAMDDPEQCPSFYRDADAASAISDTRRFIEAVRSLDTGERPLVRPVITPRFIPSCTDAALQGLGELATEFSCHVQTHCSESDWARQFVETRFGCTDAASLDGFGLLTRHTILAHSNFIDGRDMDLIKGKGAGVAHCPLSNFYFANAVFPLRDALDRHMHVGLGTDISGGYSPSLFDGCRHALSASRTLQSGVHAGLDAAQRGAPGAPITHQEAFWLATAGGAEALDLPTGSFRVGHEFDALLIDTTAKASNIHVSMADDTLDDVFQKIVLNAARANIAAVWVSGRAVVGQ